MHTKLLYVLVFFGTLLISSCSTIKNKRAKGINFVQDTLQVGYTYWWPDSGPFIGNCGDEIALAFTGTIVNLEKPTALDSSLYTPQKGSIAIKNVLKIKELGVNTYANQKFFTTDCFHNLDVKVGDKVIVYCYDYEGDYSIPGRKSILKIDAFNSPIVTSTKTYLENNQDPFSIEKDMALWATYNLTENLEQIIVCAKEMKALKKEK